MGGAVKAASTVFQQAKNEAVAAYTAVPKGVQALAQGKSLGEAIGVSAKTAFGPKVKLAKDVVGEVMPKPKVADAGTPVDPAAQAESDKKEKARAKRQAEIDILTDRPGRGGTILTDSYNYKV